MIAVAAILGFFFTGQQIAPPISDGPCRESRLEIARAHHALFAHPELRSKVTKNLIKSVLRPLLKRRAAGDQDARSCLGEYLIAGVTHLADEEAYIEGTRALTVESPDLEAIARWTFNRRHLARRPETYRSEWISRSRGACGNLARWKSCSAESLQVLASFGIAGVFLPADAEAPGWQPEELEWLDLLRSHADRSHLLGAAFASADHRIRTWALREVTERSTDPRDWNPTEVAQAIAFIRRVLRSPPSPAKVRGSDPVLADDGDASLRSDEIMGYLKSLKGLGFGSLADLSGAFRIPSPHWKDTSFFTGDGFFQHFPHEFDLYEAQWLEGRRLSKGEVEKMSLEEQRKLAAEKIEYIEREWNNTDANAPHPNMDAVKKALDELSAREASP